MGRGIGGSAVLLLAAACGPDRVPWVAPYEYALDTSLPPSQLPWQDDAEWYDQDGKYIGPTQLLGVRAYCEGDVFTVRVDTLGSCYQPCEPGGQIRRLRTGQWYLGQPAEAARRPYAVDTTGTYQSMEPSLSTLYPEEAISAGWGTFDDSRWPYYTFHLRFHTGERNNDPQRPRLYYPAYVEGTRKIALTPFSCLEGLGGDRGVVKLWDDVDIDSGRVEAPPAFCVIFGDHAAEVLQDPFYRMSGLYVSPSRKFGNGLDSFSDPLYVDYNFGEPGLEGPWEFDEDCIVLPWPHEPWTP